MDRTLYLEVIEAADGGYLLRAWSGGAIVPDQWHRTMQEIVDFIGSDFEVHWNVNG